MRIIAFASIIILAAVDQLLKAAVVAYLQPVGTITVIPGLLEWKYTENRGAAFGILADQRWIFMLLTICVVAAAVFFLLFKRCQSKLLIIALILLISGGVGNLIDRIVLGYVIDYIFVTFFPFIFNFADCCVCIGAVLFILYILFFEEKNRQTMSAEGAEQLHEGNSHPNHHVGRGGGTD